MNTDPAGAIRAPAGPDQELTVGMIIALTISPSVVDSSPFSTSGALVVANAPAGQNDKAFRGLMIRGFSRPMWTSDQRARRPASHYSDSGLPPSSRSTTSSKKLPCLWAASAFSTASGSPPSMIVSSFAVPFDA
ncbi:hypothetical protein BS329_30910 [Amycolatopsis coloradensis]|uniref:Uncharacterized protein n=1 Tax=Amycolatopsis coloradensis TaxID=76021 RepID=A0A1R0KJ34_9PSEU|nr:hypothetical protein [Amycolatopsis coloradensis]OLZ46082.1 hypothetical protein BS329_30910 [Amycolatopsis coloradensis]